MCDGCNIGKTFIDFDNPFDIPSLASKILLVSTARMPYSNPCAAKPLRNREREREREPEFLAEYHSCSLNGTNPE